MGEFWRRLRGLFGRVVVLIVVVGVRVGVSRVRMQAVVKVVVKAVASQR